MGSFSYTDDKVKPAALAGSWYPGDARELGAMLDKFLKAAATPALGGAIGVIVSPHAGYVYSAPTACFGFKAASSQKVSTVVILAPSHQYSFKGASVWPEGVFETPLGPLEVDKDLAARVMAFDERFIFRRDVFAGSAGRPENSVETQLPLIKKVFPSAKILPMIVGHPPDADMIRTVASALAAAVGDRTDVLVDVSVDQSHFHPLKEAQAIDARGLKAIEDMDVNGFWKGHADRKMEVDGFHVVAAAMLYAGARGFGKAKVLHYGTSADATGDKSSVVGYASIALYRDAPAAAEAGDAKSALTPEQKARLLTIARETLDTFVRTGKAPEYHETDPRLLLEEGAFVTLQKRGALRGCIGNIIGRGPLYRTVRDMAVAAASEDPRFRPVKADELKDIDVEISVLSKPRVVQSADEIELGKHGVIVGKGYMNRGVFLPQVATETGWTKERFLSELCSQKAGLPPDSWKDPSVKLEVFTADVFGEK
ncbi:MAG: AmmeMemoRadiSam system protein B [Deltaproteobacteria bacterium]|nr:AmmeMemoRadiSam system protein B [Deltaproteobacteria bacterium]